MGTNCLETFKHQGKGYRGLQVQSSKFQVSSFKFQFSKRSEVFLFSGMNSIVLLTVVDILTDDYCTADKGSNRKVHHFIPLLCLMTSRAL